MSELARWFYSVLMWLAQPLLRRKLRRRGLQEPGYLHAMDERFGRYAGSAGAADGNTVWIHAVSLGETRTAALLIARLRQSLPQMRLLLTHGTATGRAEGVGLLQSGDLQCWQPWDTVGATRAFLQHFRPRIGILMETEIWPNLVVACERGGVPLVLVNARMSDKSLRQAQRLAWLARAAFASLRAVWAQTEGDAIALRQLGANVKAVFGNLKFDANPKPEQIEQGRRWRAQHRRPVLMLASSRAGEEQSLLTLLAAASRPTGAESPVVNDVGDLQQAANGCQCLIVPRHPQRFDEVAALIEIHGFRVVRRSLWGAQGPDQLAEVPGKTIWLGDSLGEMALYYAMADVALLGGSFEPLGGQNLIEAAACGCPLIMGPHTFNFAQAAELAMSAGAALRVDSMAQAVAAATALVQDAARQAAMVYAADAFSGAHRGALEKTALAVLDLLEQQGVDAL